MIIESVLNNNIVEDNKEIKYIYRLIREKFSGGQAYGIEVERQDFYGDNLLWIERNEIKRISNIKSKVETLLILLNNNKVSPIHLVDILGNYVDEYVMDFQ